NVNGQKISKMPSERLRRAPAFGTDMWVVKSSFRKSSGRQPDRATCPKEENTAKTQERSPSCSEGLFLVCDLFETATPLARAVMTSELNETCFALRLANASAIFAVPSIASALRLASALCTCAISKPAEAWRIALDISAISRRGV